MSAEQRFADVVRAFGSRPGVSQGRQGFGAGTLKFGGRIFAMTSSRGEFVVKLSRSRVDALIAAGEGHRFDAGRGVAMKEWLVAGPESDWIALAEEALAFAGRQASTSSTTG
jgi:hypothetical protein